MAEESLPFPQQYFSGHGNNFLLLEGSRQLAEGGLAYMMIASPPAMSFCRCMCTVEYAAAKVRETLEVLCKYCQAFQIHTGDAPGERP
jgi:hypothetical protein